MSSDTTATGTASASTSPTPPAGESMQRDSTTTAAQDVKAEERHVFPKPASVFATFIAGAGSGAVAALVTSPLDVVKIRAQAGGHGRALHVLREIYRTEGLRGLYRGLGPTMFGLMPTWAVFFSTYNFLQKQLLEDMQWMSPGVRYAVASVGAGAVNAVAMSPVWTIRTRLATQPGGHLRLYSGMWHGIVRIAREEGWHGLFKGLAPSLLGLTHVLVQFPLYEGLKARMALRRHVRADELTAFELLLASSLSKIAASVAAYPHEVIRTRLQDQRESGERAKYRGIVGTMRTIVRESGVGALYRGMGTNLPRVTLNCAITFTSYELLLRLVKRLEAGP